jgi:undecaprenyl-diphosphatase
LSILQAAILGIVQGLTEFLPISSDGHLAVTYRLLGTKPNLAFEVFLHAATLLAMLVYFWPDIVELASSLLPSNKERSADRRLVLLIAIGTGVSGAVALVLGKFVEPLSESMVAVSLGFLATTLLLVLAEMLAGRVTQLASADKLGFLPTGVVALLQGIAVLPGVSRSGSTIAGGMFFGLSREHAARFSFLLGIPIITLASAKDLVDVLGGAAKLPGTPAALIVGFLAAGITGYLAIWGLLAFVKNHRLYWFAAYTGVLGTVILLMSTVFGRG